MRFYDPRSTGTFASGYLWLHRDDIPNIDVIKQTLTRKYGEVQQRVYYETDTHLVVPRFFTYPGLPETFPTYGVEGTPISRFEDKVTSFLDDDQEVAWEKLRDSNGGILSLPGGRGKTVLGVKKICHEGVSTSIFATMGLLDQWKKELIKRGGIPEEDIGLVQGKSLEFDKPVVLVSQDTIMRRPAGVLPDARDKFGLLIFDEAHHFVAPKLIQIPPIFRGKKIGLTATEYGSDERARFLHWVLGPMIWKSVYHTLKPTIIVKKVPFWNLLPGETTDISGNFSFPVVWKYLAKDRQRNYLILEDLEFYAMQGRNIMVLTNNVRHCRGMHKRLDGAGLIYGGVKKKEKRSSELQKKVVVAMSQIAAEGLDKPEMDTLILAMPFGARGKLEQSFYRVLRDLEKKAKPVVIVYQDPHPACTALVNKVVRVARDQGYNVKYTEAGENVEGMHEMRPERVPTTSSIRNRRFPSVTSGDSDAPRS